MLSSCSIQRHYYTGGFHLNFHQTVKENKLKQKELESEKIIVEVPQQNEMSVMEGPLTASRESSFDFESILSDDRSSPKNNSNLNYASTDSITSQDQKTIDSVKKDLKTYKIYSDSSMVLLSISGLLIAMVFLSFGGLILLAGLSLAQIFAWILISSLMGLLLSFAAEHQEGLIEKSFSKIIGEDELWNSFKKIKRRRSKFGRYLIYALLLFSLIGLIALAVAVN